MAEGILERVVQHRSTDIEEGLHGRSVPAHLLFLVHALGDDLVDRTLHERRRDRLATSTPGSIVHQHVLVALEVAEKFNDVSLKTVNAGHLAHVRVLRPAVEASKLSPAPCPAAVPQAPFRTLQVTNRLIGKIWVGRARAAVFFMCYAHSEPQSVRGLARQLGIARPNVSVAIQRLESLALLKRSIDPTDRRGVVAEQTQEGLALVELRSRSRSRPRGALQANPPLP
jgi:hypothetical protein